MELDNILRSLIFTALAFAISLGLVVLLTDTITPLRLGICSSEPHLGLQTITSTDRVYRIADTVKLHLTDTGLAANTCKGKPELALKRLEGNKRINLTHSLPLEISCLDGFLHMPEPDSCGEGTCQTPKLFRDDFWYYWDTSKLYFEINQTYACRISNITQEAIKGQVIPGASVRGDLLISSIFLKNYLTQPAIPGDYLATYGTAEYQFKII